VTRAPEIENLPLMIVIGDFQIAPAFRHQSRHRFFVPGDNDLFASRHPGEEPAKSGLCFKGGYALHKWRELNRPVTSQFTTSASCYAAKQSRKM